jgi:hypothetical protein
MRMRKKGEDWTETSRDVQTLVIITSKERRREGSS